MSLKKLSTLILLASFCCAFDKCSDGSPQMMWDPPLFAGDSKLQVIVRNDHGNQVRIWAGDKLFDQFICTYAAEIPKGKKAYFDVINQCETWKTPEAAEEYPRELEEYQKSQEQINEPQNHNQ